MVLDTITAVRTTTDKALNPGLGKLELLVWGLPTKIFCFLLRSGFKLQLRAGLETRLRARVRAQLEQSAKQVLDEILSKQNSAKKLSLLIKVMWGAILDIVQKDMFTQIWTEALHEALPAARRATSDLTKLDQFSSEEERHKAVFNAAFVASKSAALVSAKAVVARTSASMKNDKREKMWVGLMKQSVEDVVGVGATAIVAAVEHDQSGCLRASITPVAHASPEQPVKNITLADIQNNIIKFIRASYPQTFESYITSIQEDMAQAWNMSQIYFQDHLPSYAHLFYVYLQPNEGADSMQ
ncbi:unnamed protein product [Rhizoctonia solani]|uniref:Uncharacterized protein n=1 Tax=Rhizoctonia solani TaxID=456999 RepID=A0A8H3DGK3_9AGAM|nr:unnamed protein product [Rhizoctonia solani]